MKRNKRQASASGAQVAARGSKSSAGVAPVARGGSRSSAAAGVAPTGSSSRSSAAPAATPRRRLRLWHFAAALVLAWLLALEVYGPALHGPFVFDDFYLPFHEPNFQQSALTGVLRSGLRPLLMAGFLLTYRAFGLDPYYFHLINVLFHLGSAILVGFIMRKLLEHQGIDGWTRDAVSVFSGLLFLLHPLATESASYIASRSEAQSVFFFYAAFLVFLYRRSAEVSFPDAFFVLLLFGAAALTKEHAAVLPGLLLLADYYWNPGFSFAGIKRNWRLYLPILALAAVAGMFVWRVLHGAETAGFAVKDLPWYQYLFTQCRVIWVYIRLFLLPYGQNLDWDYPVSRTLLDHGAIFGLLGLVLLVAVAIRCRRRFPLASFGVLAFLLLLAPTSSVVPIKDTLAERRAYLPMIGILCVAAEFAARWRPPRRQWIAALSGVLVIAGVLTWNRNRVWAGAIPLWQDSVSKAPQNARARFQLAAAYFDEERYDEAVREYEAASKITPNDVRLLVNWAIALDRLNRQGEAIGKLLQAVSIEKDGHAFSTLGSIYAKQKRYAEAHEALDMAIRLNPADETSYIYRGNIFVEQGEYVKAIDNYRVALRVNPASRYARDGLRVAESRLGQKP